MFGEIKTLNALRLRIAATPYGYGKVTIEELNAIQKEIETFRLTPLALDAAITPAGDGQAVDAAQVKQDG